MENSYIEQRMPVFPFWRKVMYALGQLGWSLCSFSVFNAFIYFYLPPEGVEIAPFVYQGFAVFGLTVVGIIFAASRLVDAITDPIIASLSDRCPFVFGRRRCFLAISVIPVPLLSFFVFYPPIEGVHLFNAVWIAVTLCLFFLFLTIYVTPYFALVAELGRNSEDRLLLSTMISVTWAIGAIVGSQVYGLQTTLEKVASMSPTGAFQAVIGCFAVISCVFMLLPVIFVDESKYCERHGLEEAMLRSWFSTLKNKNFVMFSISDLFYWLAVTVFNSSIVYYVTVLLKLDKALASGFIAILFLGSFLFYVPVSLLCKKVGKRFLLTAAYVWLFLDCFAVALLGKFPLPAEIQGYLLVATVSVPLAAFSILPNAIVADIAEAHGIETGHKKAGMFFGARIFLQKLGIAIGVLLVPSLLVLGSEPGGNDLGVRLTAGVAMVCLLVGLSFIYRYDEKSINKVLASKEGG